MPACRTFSWHDVETACLFIKNRIEEDNFKPDYIVGLTRGGLIPAVLLSHMTGIKVVALDVSFRDNKTEPVRNIWIPEDITYNNKKVLVIDDINDTGKTFNWIIEDWNKTVLSNANWTNVRFAALVHNEASKASTDYSFLNINKLEKDVWIVYPWEQNV